MLFVGPMPSFRTRRRIVASLLFQLKGKSYVRADRFHQPQ
jgi:hypothetical protein